MPPPPSVVEGQYGVQDHNRALEASYALGWPLHDPLSSCYNHSLHLLMREFTHNTNNWGHSPPRSRFGRERRRGRGGALAGGGVLGVALVWGRVSEGRGLVGVV